MYDEIIVSKKNEVFLTIITEPGIQRELYEFFSFYVPNFQYMPGYRSKLWNGKIYLFNQRTKELYVGLFSKLKEFCKQYNYKLSTETSINDLNNISHKHVKSLGERLALPFPLRDYQIDAIIKAINNNRCLLICPTASGKSAILYSLMRYYNAKTLIVAPTVSLVSQMYSDFNHYSQNDTTFDVSKMCHCITANVNKNTSKPIVISTWQSLYNMPTNYFKKFDIVIGDECHLFQAKSLSGIMKKCENAKYRFGFTGTLNDTETHQLILEGLFGEIFHITDTKTLMDEKILADLKINCLLLEYTEKERKVVKKLTYQEEIDYIIKHTNRNKFIRNLACSLNGNTMLLFQYVQKHGKLLYKIIQDKIKKENPNRKVFFVSGETNKESREQIRFITEKETNAIIVASSGVFSVGVNIQNLENIIFSSPTKSKIKTLQSIGRGLRFGRTGKTNLYDICDNFSHKSYKNFALKHFLERVKIYSSEQFKYNIYKIDIKSPKK